MLGLTSHEPNFSLLREEVRFGGKKSQKRCVVCRCGEGKQAVIFYLYKGARVSEFMACSNN